MSEIAQIRASLADLQTRLAGRLQRPTLTAVYLDLAPLVGRLNGAVTERSRTYGRTELVRQAESCLEELKSIRRQVGLDIRLSSGDALQMGLQTAVERAQETLHRVEQIDGAAPTEWR